MWREEEATIVTNRCHEERGGGMALRSLPVFVVVVLAGVLHSGRVGETAAAFQNRDSSTI